MKNLIRNRILFALVLGLSITVIAVTAQTPQLKVSNRQVRAILDSIKAKTLTLQTEITRSRAYDSTPNAEDRVSDQLTALSGSVDSMRTNVYSRNTDVSTDINNILDRSNRINRILTRNDTSPRITSQWSALRGDVNTLAGYYGMTWDWGQPSRSNGGGNNGYPGNNNYPDRGRQNAGLNGTYRLNQAQSDNVTTVIDRSVGYYGTDQRDNVRRTLERRLASPEIIAIEKSGRTITMGSSNQAQVTFDADGIARTETNARGRTITTTVTSTGNNLTIDYTGDRVNDFNVTFDLDRSGRLKVTRRIYLENRNDTVSVSSVYDRTSDVADFSNVRKPADPYNGTNNGGSTAGNGDFYIPNGTVLTATLRNAVSTKASQVGDRFTMDVTSPNSYRGAVIEGRVVQAASSGRVSGKANIALDFDRVTMNGRSYQFAGLIQTVSSANGDSVTVNNEGTIKDTSQTGKTATRAGVGAVLGAIIGAVAGGGSGAAIGAGVGAGAGAGTVLLGGRDSIELGTGSTFTILSTSPGGARYNQ